MFTSILLKCDSKQYRQFNSHQSPNWFVHKLTNHPTIRHEKALQSFRAVSFSRRWVSDGFDQWVAIVNQTGTYQGVIDNGIESNETAGRYHVDHLVYMQSVVLYDVNLIQSSVLG